MGVKTEELVRDEMARVRADQDREAILAFVKRVNARAEADILRGNPIEGAHNRALQREVALLGEGTS